jgi:hypothetical protein
MDDRDHFWASKIRRAAGDVLTLPRQDKCYCPKSQSRSSRYSQMRSGCEGPIAVGDGARRRRAVLISARTDWIEPGNYGGTSHGRPPAALICRPHAHTPAREKRQELHDTGRPSHPTAMAGASCGAAKENQFRHVGLLLLLCCTPQDYLPGVTGKKLSTCMLYLLPSCCPAVKAICSRPHLKTSGDSNT